MDAHCEALAFVPAPLYGLAGKPAVRGVKVLHLRPVLGLGPFQGDGLQQARALLGLFLPFRLGQLVFLQPGDEPGGELAPAPAHDIDHADDREHHRADEVDEQVLHGVVQAHVQVARPGLAVDHHAFNGDAHRGIFPLRVQADGIHHMEPGILLHVHVEKQVHAVLEELPQHADGHGEAEGHHGHEHR